ncbi:MAG TPA: molecular chaperone DnaJ, partial [Bacteroidetes bacterium]|nr:molecular chaperone DnaJ [Bacteroidota bacterium]
NLKVGFSQLVLGSEVEVPTLTGKVVLKIPAGTQSGKVFRLKGKGIQHLNHYGSGDELVRIQVETPSHLSKEEKELYKRLADLEKKRQSGEGKKKARKFVF